jgi:polyisoprenoid-binding protein YceI
VGAVIAGASLLAPLGLASPAEAAVWEIDPAHSRAHFSVKHMMVSTVRGEFGKVSGTVNLDEKDITKSTVEATIDASSISTANEKRDTHLKSPDFLDVKSHPNITFKSKKVAKAKNGLKVTGDITIRGVTKEVVLEVAYTGKPVKGPQGGGEVMGATATTKLNRMDFGAKWNVPLEGGGVLVGNDVHVEIDVELKKADGKQM